MPAASEANASALFEEAVNSCAIALSLPKLCLSTLTAADVAVDWARAVMRLTAIDVRSIAFGSEIVMVVFGASD